MKHTGNTRLAIVAFTLAVGLGTVWGFGSGALYTLVDSLVGDTSVDYEDIVVDTTGTPYIQTRIRGNWNHKIFRTLDGKEVGLAEASTDTPSLLAPPYQAPRLFEYPIRWSERVAGINLAEKPPVSWLVLRDASRPGKAVFIGYDLTSNQRIGYVGRGGFRTTLPPVGEQFDMGSHTLASGSNRLATSGGITYGEIGSIYGSTRYRDERSLQPWQIFVCDGDLVREVNLRTRQVRVVKEFPDLVGITVIGTNSMQLTGEQEFQPPEPRLLVRTQDQLVVYNTFDDVAQSFPIPLELRDKGFSVNTVNDGRLLLHVSRGKWERGKVSELFTINTAGEIVEQQTVRLVWGSNSQDSPFFALIPAAIVPTLFGWLGGIFLVAPLIQMQEWQVADFAEGIHIAWDKAGLGLLVVLALSLILTANTYRWQKKFSRSNTALWTTFVFLTTLPGFFAYWIMHRREPMGECAQCGTNVPQDRDVCARCAAPLPEPKLLGTEIFA